MAKRGPKEKGPVTEKDWEMFSSLCGIQCTLEEIAAVFKCSDTTIERRVWKHFGEKFEDVRRQKAKAGHASLRRKQYETAMSGNVVMQIWLGKQYLGQSDKREEKLDATLVSNNHTTTTAKIVALTPAERLELLKKARGES